MALTKYQFPRLLRMATFEDGPVEWATFAALVGLAIFLFRRLRVKDITYPKSVRAAMMGLALLCLLAAGEEISWGQRILGLETGERFRELNYQGETNLHNLLPPQLFNGLIMLTFLFLFCLYPLYKHFRSSETPWWLPSRHLAILSLGVILVNHYRVSRIEHFGNVSVFLLVVILTIVSLRRQRWGELAACLSCLVTSSTLYWCRHVLKLNNMQYEIRELLVVLVVAQHCHEALGRLATHLKAPTEDIDSTL